MELPVWTPRGDKPLTTNGVPLVNRKWMDRIEMQTAASGVTDLNRGADRAGNIGPSKYDIAASARITRPRSASHRFSGAPRLGYVLALTKEGDGYPPVPTGSGSLAATIGDARSGTTKVGSPGSFNRPKSARVVCKTGGGHWTDGMAQGTTIVGVYNRFKTQVPGVAAYNISAAAEKNRAHTSRASFGTSSRFAGGKPHTTPKPLPPGTNPLTRRASGGGGGQSSTLFSTAAFSGGSISPRVPNSGGGGSSSKTVVSSSRRLGTAGTTTTTRIPIPPRKITVVG